MEMGIAMKALGWNISAGAFGVMARRSYKAFHIIQALSFLFSIVSFEMLL